MTEKFYSESMTKEEREKIAINKKFKSGSCKKSAFASGGHRVGWMPEYRPNDGGVDGVSCSLVCIECGKKFKDRGFVLCKRPVEG